MLPFGVSGTRTYGTDIGVYPPSSRQSSVETDDTQSTLGRSSTLTLNQRKLACDLLTRHVDDSSYLSPTNSKGKTIGTYDCFKQSLR